MYSPDKPHTVYAPKQWFSDLWSSGEYEQDYDPQLSLLEQIKNLSDNFPHLSLVNTQTINSEYSNYIIGCKDMYLCTDAIFECSGCMYSTNLKYAKDCLDCYDME